MNKDTLRALWATPEPFPAAEQELRDWLKRCAPILAGRSPAEIAHLAILGGFEEGVIYHVMSTYIQDEIGRTTADKRASFHMLTFEHAIEDFNKRKAALEYVKELDLCPLWEDVIFYQTGESIKVQKENSNERMPDLPFAA